MSGVRVPRQARQLTRLLAVAVSAVFLIGACTGGTPAPSSGPAATASQGAASPSAAARKPVTITAWVPPMFQDIKGYEDQSKEVGDFWQVLADWYVSENPNVKVELTRLSWDDMDSKLTVAIAAGTQPDVTFDSPNRTYKYYKSGGFEAVDGIYTPEEETDFFDGMLFYSKDPLDGKLYQVPTTTGPGTRIGLVEDFWADAGKLDLLPETGGDWTFAEFEAAIDAIKDTLPEGAYPMCGEMANAGGMDVNLFAKYIGGLTFSADDQAIAGDANKAAYAKGLGKVYDYYKRGWFAPEPQALANGDCNPLMQGKKVAVFSQPREDLVQAGLDAGTPGPFKMRYVSYPADPEDVVPFPPGGSVGFQVGKQTDPEKRTEVWNFVRWLNDTERMNLYKTSSYAVGWIYGRKSVPIEGYAGAGSFLEDSLAYMAKPQESEPALGWGVYNTHTEETRACEFPEWQAVFNGNKTVAEGTDAYWACATAAVGS